MLTFAIPTWNRADSLRRCVEAMAAQRPDGIIIVDGGSTDHTPEVGKALVDAYPEFIKYIRFEDRGDGFCTNYRRAIECCDDEYVWTFGDDDLLMESAYNFVKGLIKGSGYDFYHVAETIRVKKAEGMNGTVWHMCNRIGWLDFTGFISGNIGRTELMKQGVRSPRWDLYSTSSFPQSLALLESMYDRQGMMVEMGCVESSAGNPETLKRWADDQICWKYLYVGNGLKALQDAGIIQEPASEVFFRYLEESLFSRIMRDFTGRTVLDPDLLQESDWECFLHMAHLVVGERGEILTKWIEDAKDIYDVYKEQFKVSAAAYKQLTKRLESVSMPVYPTAYLPGD